MNTVSNLSFINELVKQGKLKWCKYPWNHHAEIIGTGLTVCDDEYDDVWSIWTYRYTIHVHTIGRELAKTWPYLDWEKLQEMGKKLDYEFSLTPDF